MVFHTDFGASLSLCLLVLPPYSAEMSAGDIVQEILEGEPLQAFVEWDRAAEERLQQHQVLLRVEAHLDSPRRAMLASPPILTHTTSLHEVFGGEGRKKQKAVTLDPIYSVRTVSFFRQRFFADILASFSCPSLLS